MHILISSWIMFDFFFYVLFWGQQAIVKRSKTKHISFSQQQQPTTANKWKEAENVRGHHHDSNSNSNSYIRPNMNKHYIRQQQKRRKFRISICRFVCTKCKYTLVFFENVWLPYLRSFTVALCFVRMSFLPNISSLIVWFKMCLYSLLLMLLFCLKTKRRGERERKKKRVTIVNSVSPNDTANWYETKKKGRTKAKFIILKQRWHNRILSKREKILKLKWKKQIRKIFHKVENVMELNARHLMFYVWSWTWSWSTSKKKTQSKQKPNNK